MTPPETAKMVQLIQTTFHRGRGTVDDPHRTVIALFTPAGELLLERDPHRDAEGDERTQMLREALALALDRLESAVPDAAEWCTRARRLLTAAASPVD